MILNYTMGLRGTAVITTDLNEWLFDIYIDGKVLHQNRARCWLAYNRSIIKMQGRCYAM